MVDRGHFIDGDLVAVDTETTGLGVWHGDAPFAFGFCNEQGDTAYFEWPVDPWTRCVVPDLDELAQVRAFMADDSVSKVFHNAKYDVRIMQNAFGIETAGDIHDTMFAAHVCNTREPTFKLKTLADKYLDFPKDDETELQKLVLRLRRKAKDAGWSIAFNHKQSVEGTWKTEAATPADYWLPRAFDPNDTTCETYCVGDVERTMLLFLMYRQVLRDNGWLPVYEMERALWHVTYDMETRGVRIYPDKVDAEIPKIRAEAKRHHDAVVKASGRPDFNIDSPRHMAELLYDRLGLKVERRTKTGQPSADAKAMIAHFQNPVVRHVFQYRAAKGNLVNFWQQYRDLKTRDDLVEGGWCIHPDFRQMGPVTGRYACRRPNLQNVPDAKSSRSPVPIQARTPFGPRPGYVWYLFDYSQLEVRIFADVAQEQTMLAAIANGEDIHTATTEKAWGGEGNDAALRAVRAALELEGDAPASNDKLAKAWKWLDVEPDDRAIMPYAYRDDLADKWLSKHNYSIVDAEDAVGKKNSRTKGKTTTFLKIYGGGASALKYNLECSHLEAQQVLREYDDSFPRISEYTHELSSQARHDGHIINRFGRCIGVHPDLAYQSVNYMVQGSAADLLKHGMVSCAAYLRSIGIDAHIVMTIHDEVVFEFNKRHAYACVLRELKKRMEDHGGAFNVETPVDVEKVVRTWDQKQGVEL